ncbi:Endoglucanase [Pleurostoma richardsiae]|uniref:Endoglucanase n=1 Tax=Pleurostoma richardsiae TaxID=41990 RepID=A0AA38RAF5_9PEZI|nr:Endoglucanase [Pleurostoma richardsiae]
MKSSITAIVLLAASVWGEHVRVPSLPVDGRWTKGHRDLEARTENGSAAAWPYGPFSTKGSDIVNTRGDAVTWAGVNWPLSGETMVPEGLEWASAEQILSDVASVGFNFIRMGYAIEMIDQVYDRDGEDVPLEVAMITALGFVNGTRVTNEIIAKNPGWTKETTRFEIWSDIASIAAKKAIFIHPDVHVGKAQWCCSHTDGNAWFDDLTFNASNWHRGLAYVATWAKKHPNIVSMSLRNELRESWNVTDLYYNWETLVGNMSAGADAIHEANSGILITWSGMQYDQDLSALTTRKNLLTAPCYKCTAIRDDLRRDPVYFDLDSHPWADKIVWELHLYGSSEDVDTGTCPIIEAGLYRNGFNALGVTPPPACNITGDCPSAQRLTPVILSEFGHAQDKTMLNDTLQSCIQAFTKRHGVSWAMWSLAGSYRIRQGAQGVPDTWGLTNFNWTGWIYPDGIESYWKPWVAAMNVTKLD